MEKVSVNDSREGWKLGFLAAGLDAFCSDSEVFIHGGVYTSSAEVLPGSLYVARRGEKIDGHSFIGEAKKAGAIAAVVEDPRAAIAHQMPYILVKDSTIALGAIAKLHLATLRQKSQGNSPVVVGITGSAGKTTTKDLLYSLLNQLGETVAPEKSFNNEVGLPLTVLKATSQTKYLVLEMGASAPGELTYLTEIAPLDYAVELMVGSAHLGGYGSVAALAKAKAEMLSGLRNLDEAKKYRAELPESIITGLQVHGVAATEGKTEKTRFSKAIVNLDDENVRSFLAPGPQVLGFSSAGVVEGGYQLPIRVKDRGVTEDQRAFATVLIENEEIVFELGLTGAHNLSNALAAATVAYDLGLSPAKIKQVLLEHRAASPHRMNVFSTGEDIMVIDDSYNANLDSMKAGIQTLVALGSSRPGRTVAVLGDMLELGEESARLHRELAKAINEAGIDCVFAIGTAISVMAEELVKSIDYQQYQSLDRLSAKLLETLRNGDTLLLKGSNSSGIWQIADKILREGGNR